MRRHPTKRPRARRIGPHPSAWIAALACLVLAAPPLALADVSIEEEGRQTRTRPKQPQREYNGVLLDPTPSEVGPRPSGRTLTKAGRGLSSEPQGRVSVGIIGCPGCSEAVRGVVVDARRRSAVR